MPFPDDLLNPIEGPNPSGANLRYDPVYDKIKEARREEAQPPPGMTEQDRKVSDNAQVIKLTIDLLTNGPDPILPQQLPLFFIMSETWAEKNNTKQVVRGTSAPTFINFNANGTGPIVVGQYNGLGQAKVASNFSQLGNVNVFVTSGSTFDLTPAASVNSFGTSANQTIGSLERRGVIFLIQPGTDLLQVGLQSSMDGR